MKLGRSLFQRALFMTVLSFGVHTNGHFFKIVHGYYSNLIFDDLHGALPHDAFREEKLAR